MTANPSTWMTDNYDAIQNKPFQQITVFGSHDSGMSTLVDVLGSPPLVPLHSDFDRLEVPRIQFGQIATVDQDGDAPRDSGLAGDQPRLFECNHHLMD